MNGKTLEKIVRGAIVGVASIVGCIVAACVKAKPAEEIVADIPEPEAAAVIEDEATEEVTDSAE